MIIEQLIFTFISFAIFVYMFFRMIKNNDTSYVFVLVIEAIGITLNFAEVLFGIKLNLLFMILKYIFAILFPITIIILEKKYVPLFEMINVMKSNIYMFFGDTKKAKQALISILDKNQNSYQAHRLLAEIYEKEGGMRKAIDEYVQAVDLNKQDYDSYYKVAELLNNLDKKEEASEMLFNLLNKKPDYYKATELLGNILISKEMYKEAVNIYQNALKYDPLSFEINYNLGIAYTMLNDFQNAKICYEKAADINSLSYNSKYSLAEIALIYKELDQAEKYFMEALEDEELSADSYYELSKIAMIKNDKDKAIQFANIAIDIDASKVVPKIKKDPIFIPVIARISIPFNINSNEDIKHKLTEKELIAKEHLEDMFEITRNLSYADIKLLKNEERKVQKDIEENQNENQRDF